MFEFIALVIAITALVKASRQKGQISDLTKQLGENGQVIERLRLDIARLGSASASRRPEAPPAQRDATPSAPETPVPPQPIDTPAPSPSAPSAPEVDAALTPPEPASAPTSPEPAPVPPTTAEAPWQSVAVAQAATSDGSAPPDPPPPTDARGAQPTPPPATPISMEEWLGTRWAVWLGGLALGLGGLLLVRYSIEQGYFGPGARIVLGLMFAAALLAAGEWFRRNERDVGIDMIPAAHIPSVLTAAGAATLFGTIYAAHALYGFIGSGTTFVLLGLVGVGTTLAAALHGPALAGFGLLGAYAAPLLVSSARPSPWPVVVYLAVVAASAMGLARLQNWIWLAASAVGGAVLWGLVFLGQIMSAYSDWMLAGYTHAFVQLLLAAVFLAFEPHPVTRDADARIDRVATGALGALTVLAIMMLGQGRHDLASAIPFVLATAGLLLVTAWRNASASFAACYAGLVVLACIATWPGLSGPPPSSLMAPELAPYFRTPENVQTYLMLAILMSAAVCLGTAQRLWIGGQLPASIAAVYALAATVTPMMALVLTWARVKYFDASLGFAFAGLALAAVFGVATDRFQHRDDAHSDSVRVAIGALAVAAIAAVSFALIATLDRGYLTAALALTAWGAAWVADRRDIPLLRHVVTTLALIVLARIVWDPRIMGADVGRFPIFNWLLVGYGVPAAAFYSAARLMERRGADLPQRLSDAVALLLAGLLAFFQIRHALNDGDIFAPTSGHIELGLMALVSLGFSNALMRLDLGRRNVIFHWASIAFAAISAVLIGLGLGLVENPLFSGDRVLGPIIFSSLILGYLLPGIAALYVARASRGSRPDWFVNGLGVLAALLMFGWVTLEVRHAFQGPSIVFWRTTGSAELWTYSAMWLLLGVLFLAYGIWRDNLMARIASAVLVALSIAKVFLVDLAGLTGLWRALSFIVLGVVLIGIGLAYQTFVFAKPRRSPSGPDDETPAPPTVA